MREVGEGDCWRRVLRRSAGCRRMEVVKPEVRPARRWNAGVVLVVGVERWDCFGR